MGAYSTRMPKLRQVGKPMIQNNTAPYVQSRLYAVTIIAGSKIKREKAKVACAPPLRVTSDGRTDRKCPV